MAIAFAGTAPYGAQILQSLLDGPGDGRPGRDVALVISQPDRPAGRGKKLTPPPVAALATERGLRLEQPTATHSDEMLALYAELGISTIIVTAFGQMIREPLLTDYLMLNVHGSLLPAYRGAAPVERAIMDGHSETGVGIMQMEAGLDTGPVAVERRVHIDLADDGGSVFAKLAEAGGLALHDALDLNDAGSLTFTPQPDAGATYAHKIVAADRVVDFNHSARAVHDQVRALSPHIGAFSFVDQQRLGIWRTAPISAAELEGEGPAARDVLGKPGAIWHSADRMIIGCIDEAVDVLELQPPGKRRMAAGDWLRGLRAPLHHASPEQQSASRQ